jgi:hypothetical protein
MKLARFGILMLASGRYAVTALHENMTMEHRGPDSDEDI